MLESLCTNYVRMYGVLEEPDGSAFQQAQKRIERRLADMGS
jgi:hypothetical protein